MPRMPSLFNSIHPKLLPIPEGDEKLNACEEERSASEQTLVFQPKEGCPDSVLDVEATEDRPQQNMGRKTEIVRPIARRGIPVFLSP